MAKFKTKPLTQFTANAIWDKLFCKKNENLNKEEQMKIIQNYLEVFALEQFEIGKRTILNHFSNEINNIKNIT